MKAKEYIKELRSKPVTKKIADKFLIDFLEEGQKLCEKRGNTDAIMLGVFREMDMKWQSIARAIPEIQLYGYRDFLSENMPNLKKVMNW